MCAPRRKRSTDQSTANASSTSWTCAPRRPRVDQLAEQRAQQGSAGNAAVGRVLRRQRGAGQGPEAALRVDLHQPVLGLGAGELVQLTEAGEQVERLLRQPLGRRVAASPGWPGRSRSRGGAAAAESGTPCWRAGHRGSAGLRRQPRVPSSSGSPMGMSTPMMSIVESSTSASRRSITCTDVRVATIQPARQPSTPAPRRSVVHAVLRALLQNQLDECLLCACARTGICVEFRPQQQEVEHKHDQGRVDRCGG